MNDRLQQAIAKLLETLDFMIWAGAFAVVFLAFFGKPS